MTISGRQEQALLEHHYRGEHPFKTLMYLYRHDRGKLAAALVMYIIKHSPVWIMPLLTANIIDIVSQPQLHSISEFWLNAVILAVIVIQNVPTHYLFVRFISIAIRQVEADLRSTICRRLQHLSFNFYTRRNTGALQTKVLRDVEIIEQLGRQLFSQVPGAITNALAAIIITAIKSPWFLIFFVATVPLAVGLTQALRGTVKRHNVTFRREIEGMSSRVVEMIQLIPVTRAHGAELVEIEKIDQKLEKVRAAGIRLDSINAIFGALAWVVFQLFNALALLTAAWVYYTRWLPITIGDVVLFTGYFNTIANSVMNLTTMLPDISKGFESIRSVGEILECPDLEHNTGKAAVAAVEGRFVFDSVNFTYPDTNESAVKGLSLRIEPGEAIAIVGPSGAGKSTVLNLAIGFLRPNFGRILLDGRDMNDLDLRTYRRFLSVVAQETILFDGTVRENITYGVKDVNEARLRQVIKDANALDFTERLPDGLDTLIGERGARLSGGEKQRIAIARALIRDPRVLILDEATSALDSVTEAQIQEALERLMQGRTTFVVAHRLSTVRQANRVLVMERGQVIEIGAHDELMARGGAYARLREMQAV